MDVFYLATDGSHEFVLIPIWCFKRLDTTSSVRFIRDLIYNYHKYVLPQEQRTLKKWLKRRCNIYVSLDF